jgi:hypothetical protein
VGVMGRWSRVKGVVDGYKESLVCACLELGPGRVHIIVGGVGCVFRVS